MPHLICVLAVRIRHMIEHSVLTKGKKINKNLSCIHDLVSSHNSFFIIAAEKNSYIKSICKTVIENEFNLLFHRTFSCGSYKD